jgi:hypothetical protein
MKYYVLVVTGGIEPDLRGPFETRKARDAEAFRIHALTNEDDGVFQLGVSGTGKLTVSSYSAAFFRRNRKDEEEE